MQYSAILRVLVVGGAVVAAAGSATSGQQQQGYYPRGQSAQGPQPAHPIYQPGYAYQPGYPQQRNAQPGYAQQASAYPQQQVAYGEPYGGATYGGTTYGAYQSPPSIETAPVPEPQTEPEPEPAPEPEPQPEAKPAAKSSSTSSIPQKRTQWVCNATGWWQKCESAGYPCYAQSSMMLGFGTTESAARLSAEMQCNTSMSRLMSVNFTYRTSVTQRCKAVSCSAPNSK